MNRNIMNSQVPCQTYVYTQTQSVYIFLILKVKTLRLKIYRRRLEVTKPSQHKIYLTLHLLFQVERAGYGQWKP